MITKIAHTAQFVDSLIFCLLVDTTIIPMEIMLIYSSIEWFQRKIT